MAEVASLLKVSPKRVRNMMSGGAFQSGEHFFRRRGIGPRFVRWRVDAWLRDSNGGATDTIPMARATRGNTLRGSGENV